MRIQMDDPRDILERIRVRLELQIAPMMAAIDAKVLASATTWIFERKAALAAWDALPETKALLMSKDIGSYYAKAYAIAGGKGNYWNIHNNSDDMLRKIIKKDCARTARSRNATIIKKLIKHGATQISDSTYARTSDGFHGTYALITDEGEMICTIDTILAGGYNIQCLHVRTLVHISKPKL